MANAIPVLAGGGPPIDMGRQFRDGRPLFGPGKTWRGLIAGIIMAVVTATVQSLLNPLFLESVLDTVVLLPEEYLLFSTTGLLGLLMGFGGLTGDLIGSFIKRRLNMDRGAAAPGIDQLDFLIGAVLLSVIIQPIAFFQILLLLIATPLIHLTTNIVGYLLKVKKEPW